MTTLKAGQTFTHLSFLEPSWVPAQGQRYAEAPKALMRITKVAGGQVWYTYALTAGRGRWVMYQQDFLNRYGDQLREAAEPAADDPLGALGDGDAGDGDAEAAHATSSSSTTSSSARRRHSRVTAWWMCCPEIRVADDLTHSVIAAREHAEKTLILERDEARAEVERLLEENERLRDANPQGEVELLRERWAEARARIERVRYLCERHPEGYFVVRQVILAALGGETDD